ncbi:hypothetical protein [Asanoa ishikariensis]|uniref:hypothetical protein n=1 Tax=Asanoa ishikariensis TaxID=137265 RepID=UPI001EF3CA08|nr:hypothetical protein [Asanoa ishikariensis]
MTGFDGFREFVETHNGAWSRLAFVLAGNHTAAEDLLQTALFKAAKSWHRIRRYEQTAGLGPPGDLPRRHLAVAQAR